MIDFYKRWKEIQGMSKTTSNIEADFERKMFSFTQECFSDNFRVCNDKEHFPKGIKNLDGLKPDILIIDKKIVDRNISNIERKNIKMILELTTSRKIDKVWEDAIKYKEIRKNLTENNIALGAISLFGVPPSICNIRGNTCAGIPDIAEMETELMKLYASSIADGKKWLQENRWTFAAFLKPIADTSYRPWWCWVSNTPLTKSFNIPVEAGSILIPPVDKDFNLHSAYSAATNASAVHLVAVAPSCIGLQESLDLIPVTNYIVNPLELLFVSINEILTKRNNLILLPDKTSADDYSPHSGATNRATTIYRPF